MHVYVDQLEHFECAVCNARIDCTDKTPFTETTCPGCASKVTVPGLFGHYILLKRLGEGGTGPVYRAKDTKLNRVVAIKILHKVLSLNPELVEFFKHQARSASSLSHSNVMKIFELGRHAEQHYITMELIDGQNLRELLYADTVSEEEVLHIGLGISQGLEAAHERGLIHGDVRPKNIFINHEGIPKIGDFGLARSISKGSSRPFSWVSPYYTAPERLDSGEDTIFSDMYGLGATLYQALVGRPPFDDPDTEKVLHLKAGTDVPDVREARPDIGLATAAVINRLLAREPGRRYADYADLIEAFREALRPEQPSPEELARTAQIASSATMPIGPVAEAGEPPRRNRIAWVAGAALVVLAGGLAYHFAGGAADKPSPVVAPPGERASSDAPGPATGGGTDLDLQPELAAAAPSTTATPVVAAVPATTPGTNAVAVATPPTPAPVVAPEIPPPGVPGAVVWLKAGTRSPAGWADASGAARDAQTPPDAPAGSPPRFTTPAILSYTVVIAFRASGTPNPAGSAFKTLLATGTPDQKNSRCAVFADRDFPSQMGYAVGGQVRPDAFTVSGPPTALHVFHLVAEATGPDLRIRAGLDGSESSPWVLESPALDGGDPLWHVGGLPGLEAGFPGEIVEIQVYDRALTAEESASALASLTARIPAPIP